MSTPDPLDYRPGAQTRGDYVDQTTRRSLQIWVLLIAVWVVGISVWGAYVVLLALLVHRFLSV